jgi:hypothetical protein
LGKPSRRPFLIVIAMDCFFALQRIVISGRLCDLLRSRRAASHITKNK